MSTFSSWKNGRNRICSDNSKVKKSPYVNAGFTYFGRSLSPYNIAKKIHRSSRFDLTNNFDFFCQNSLDSIFSSFSMSQRLWGLIWQCWLRKSCFLFRSSKTIRKIPIPRPPASCARWGPDAWYAWCASHAWCALGRWWPWWKSSISTKTSGAENPPKKTKRFPELRDEEGIEVAICDLFF